MPHSVLLLTMVLAPIGAQDEPVDSGPYDLRGRVVDVFDGNRVLLSIGKDQEARKGLKGFIVRAGPDSRSTILFADFLEVGAKHSIVAVSGGGYSPFGEYRNPYAGFFLKPEQKVNKAIRLQVDDTVVWHSYRRPPIQIPGATREYLRPGGAVIDLTVPSGPKLGPVK